MADTTQDGMDGHDAEGGTRRDFLYLAAGAVGAVGVGFVAWPFIDSMNPAADTLALSSIDVDTGPIEEGQGITVMWQGKPVFLRRRTAAEIEEARAVDPGDLRDPETDEERVIAEDLLVVIGVCTHLGCVPLGQRQTEPRGDYGGYFCPCHGSHYDTSGRIRQGPAPLNLPVPPYEFTDETRIRIG